MVSTAGGIIIAILVLSVIGMIGWIVFTQMRARRLGIPPPSFKSYIPFVNSDPYSSRSSSGGGLTGWFRSLNPRSASGAYEQPLAGGGGSSSARRGFGPLDPDEAWDARVGLEADTYGPYGAYDGDEERGLAGGFASGGRGDAGAYELNVAAPGAELDAGDAGDVGKRGRHAGNGRNPFDDGAEPSNMSLRGVSPRPIDTEVGAGGSRQQQATQDDSPTGRRSMFRENV